MKKSKAVVATRPGGVGATTIFDGNFIAPTVLGAAASALPLNLDAKLVSVALVDAAARAAVKASEPPLASTTALPPPPPQLASASAPEAHHAAARAAPRAVHTEAAAVAAAADADAGADAAEQPRTSGSLAAILASLETEREACAKFEMRLMSRLVRG